MDLEALQSLTTTWLNGHSQWVGVAIFVLSFLESMILIGIVLPGVVLLAAAGFVAGTGAMELLPALACAAAGATLGDCLSYWLGHRYHTELKQMWPFCRYPGLIRRGEEFFAEQGAYGIVLGRFIGPLRAVVPMAAGMLDMPARQFVFIDIISACAWAPVYVGPGYLLGASIQMHWPTEYIVAGIIAAVLTLMLLPALKRRLRQ